MNLNPEQLAVVQHAGEGGLCATCAKAPATSHSLKDPARLVCSTCLHDEHWEGFVEKLRAGDPKVVVAEGEVFAIGEEAGNRHGFGRGHGGSLFRIRFKDGRRVDSTNVWHCGEVPERWRVKLPDNAAFIPPCGERWVTPERLAQVTGVRLWCGEAEGHAGLCKMGRLAWTEHGPLLCRKEKSDEYETYKEGP